MLTDATCTSFKFSLVSHTDPQQYLGDHLFNVADILVQMYDAHQHDVPDPELREALWKLGMSHDFGKATSYFQNDIKNPTGKRTKNPKKNHALISALFAYWYLPENYKMFGYLAVKRHHGDINNGNDEFSDLDKYEILKMQINDIKSNSETQRELEYIYSLKLDDFFEFVTKVNMLKIKQRFIHANLSTLEVFDFICNMYSKLLSADKLQLLLAKLQPLPKIPVLPDHKPYGYIENYKNDVRSKFLQKPPEYTDLKVFEMRDEIFEVLKREIPGVNLRAESFFSINIPTGLGKTFLAYYTALYFVNELERTTGVRSKIIYALPFMSVIDQNYDELVKAIKSNEGGKQPSDSDTLKYHSLTETDIYNTRDENDENVQYKNIDARFCNDNWQSNIVVTTFVQLFDTIFHLGDGSKSQRFHQLENSVIILDEIQAIDEKFYYAIREVFKLLASVYHIKFIFVTATMPLLIESHDLIPNSRGYFERLDRIVIHNHTQSDTYLDEFEKIVTKAITEKSDKSFLIVLNTIDSAKQVFEYIQKHTTGRKYIYLSTEIYPKERLRKIKEIKESKEKFIVVSTQLVEAGVDIDLDIVFRDFAPLSSLIQAIGRANRNGLNGEPSEVYLYKLKDHESDRYYYSYIYPSFLMEITKNILTELTIKENEIYELNQRYARAVNDCISPDKSADILKYIKELRLKKLRDEFKLISDDYAYKYDIFIIGDERCEQLRQALKNIKRIKSTMNRFEYNGRIRRIFRELGEYRISLYASTYNEIKSHLDTESFQFAEFLPFESEAGEKLYSKETGIIKKRDNKE